jgi:hypothetical protein
MGLKHYIVYILLLFDFLASEIGLEKLNRPIFTSVTKDRRYDFKNIFAEKFVEKYWRFLLKPLLVFWKNMIITLVFEKNANFLQKMGRNRRKL